MNTLMKGRPGLFTTVILGLILTASLPNILRAQAYISNGSTKITVEGTSNLHDWVLNSSSGTCTGSFVMDAGGNITGLNGLNFTMAVTTLKSEHGSTMDNNAYKAMASDKYPNIKFSSPAATVHANGGGSYTITAPGKLYISSGAKDVTLTATAKMNADKSVTINGSYKLVTTDYNVKPISIMLGAIKTSANVNIVYSLIMRPQ